MRSKPRPTNFILLDHARQLRHGQTPPEQLLWSVLRAHRMGGLRFRRQEPIGPYIVDFVCHETILVIEIDGASHEDKAEYDCLRDQWLREQGYRVLRVFNEDVTNDLDAVARAIAREAGVAWD